MTPTEIDDDVKKLISKLSPGSTPVYLKVEPESFSQIKECFPAVEEKIKRDGGSRVIGWQIWKTDFLVEAEFHAVWKSPQGELKDITPKQQPVSTILFLPDSKRRYTGAQVDNIRINISENELVDDLIRVAEAKFKIENEGERAFQRELKLSGGEAKIYMAVCKAKDIINTILQQGMNKEHLCFCGSMIRYKSCHGDKLNDLLRIL